MVNKTPSEQTESDWVPMSWAGPKAYTELVDMQFIVSQSGDM